MLRTHPGVAERLTVEITETAAIQDIDETRAFVSRVKDLGCRIAIDDFGAGYTSFRNLRKLGVDLVKIDGAFVAEPHAVGGRSRFRPYADRSVRASGSRLKTVAEWVQDEAGLGRDAGGLGLHDYLQGVLVGLASAERPWEVAEVAQAHRA